MDLQRVYEFPHPLMLEEGERCVSIYMPTHTDSHEWKQDRTRFKNLLGQVENSLSEDMRRDELEAFLKPLYDILENPYFWNYVSLGLGVLLNEKGGIYYILNRKIEEYADVAREFYIKPLIRNFQSYDKYHILGLSRNEFILYEGSRYGVEEVKLPEGTITKKDDLIDEEAMRGKVLNLSSTKMGANFHGHNTKNEGVENVMDTFFRYVDDFVNNTYSKRYQIPLILLTVVENQSFFRKLTKNKYLLESGINKSLSSVTDLKELKEEVWEVIEPLYLEKTKLLVGRFQDASGELRASVDPLEIAHACVDGRVDSLIVEANRLVGGVYDRKARKFIEGDMAKYYIGDLINQLAIMALEQNAKVVVLPKERMPSDTGLAAIFRF